MFRIDINNYFDNPKSNKFFTPIQVVEQMFKLLETNKPNFTPKTILEPCFGAGNILFPTIEKFTGTQITGVEIDKSLFEKVRDKVNNQNVHLLNQDFTFLTHNNKFDLILCNPPFAIIENGVQKKGYWRVFINKCFDLLTEKGTMIFILPNHWTINTSKHLKQYLEYLSPVNFIPIEKGIFRLNSIACQIVMWDMDNKNYALKDILQNKGGLNG